jgi:DmsE family decaheme c-type cytochrome
MCPGSAFRAGSLCRLHRCAVGIAAATLIIIPTIIFLSPAAEADAQSDAVLALRDFVQLLDRQPSNIPQDESGNAAIAALASFSERIGVAQPSPTAELPKLAEADNLIDFLRGLNSSSQPSSAPSEISKKGPVAGGTKASSPVEATYVGAKVCATCHATQAESFSHTLMGRIGKTQKGKFDCENCHGPGSAHVKAGGGRGVGGIISFRPEDQSRTAEENNAICLGCHEKGDRTLWHGSTHEERGLMCTNCHTIMKDVSRKYQLKTVAQVDTCFQCHKDIRAKFARSSHMPVPEGKMVCTNCHNPHGSYTEHLLKEATVNDVCFQCHAEKRGPFLWEHPPVVENCLNCHDPHGTINDNLLKVARPRLCQRCHNAANSHPANPRNPISVFAINSGCVNCHSQIHGSNSPGGQFFHR